jgi:TonB family protein
MRIKRLLGCSNNAGAPQFAVLLLLALIATISASYATTLARAQKATAVSAIAPSSGSAVAPGQSSANPSTAQPLRGIYRIWLQQDVRWIITPQESDAFLRLQNDNERDAFISSFWSRRDPPGSGNGNYREAYYARMAYANQHFASNTRVGWSTDRGHVYLLYGKPDSIEAHPGGGEYPTKDGSQSLSYPFEIWHYQHLAGIGDNVGLVFVDSCRCGNYNYTVDHPGQTGAAAPQAIPLASRLFTASRVSFPPTGSVVPQAGDSTIAGIVFDKTGAVIARASVKATSSDGSFEIATRTGADGRYSLASLPAGRYTIEAAARGFDNLIQQDVPVEKSQQLGLNLKLKVGAVQENMTVVAPAAAPPVVASIALPPPPAPEQSGKPTGPIRVSSGTMAGAVIKKVDPIYPPDAKASHVSGTVVLRATISKLGTIENLEVVSGPPILIMSAVDAVKQWVYKPYLLNGEPTEVATTININYTFGESDPPADTTASASGDLQVRKIGDGVSVPLPIYIVDAQYSPEARAAQFSGVVLVGLVVDPQGLPRDVHVVRSVGMGLDERAVEAVRQYRFRPAMEHNKPVPAALNVEVNFRSDNKPDAISKSAGAAVAASRVTLPDGASAPVLIHSVEPEFTEEARKAKLMGVVLVNFTVDRRGRPQNVHVLRGVGHGLDGKAVEAVRQYRFKPAMKDSQPVEEALNVEVNFQIF